MLGLDGRPGDESCNHDYSVGLEGLEFFYQLYLPLDLGLHVGDG